MQNKIILFDIDYTLFDVGKYRALVFAKLYTFFPQTPDFMTIANLSYDEIRKTGWFEITKFTKQLLTHVHTTVNLKTLEDVWRDVNLIKASIYPEAGEVLQKLSKDFTLGIFSSGITAFQKSKIATLEHFFAKEHIHIHELKDEKFPEIIEKCLGKKIILVDDYIPVIEKAKQVDQAIVAIWIKRGKLSKKVAPSKAYPPDFIIENLTQLPALLHIL